MDNKHIWRRIIYLLLIQRKIVSTIQNLKANYNEFVKYLYVYIFSNRRYKNKISARRKLWQNRMKCKDRQSKKFTCSNYKGEISFCKQEEHKFRETYDEPVHRNTKRTKITTTRIVARFLCLSCYMFRFLCKLKLTFVKIIQKY